MCWKLREGNQNARCASARRAFSLIELLSVLTIIGLLSSMAFLRFGTTTFSSTSTAGFVRTLMLDLRQARASTISTGENHYLLFTRSGGQVTSYTLYRSTSGDDVVVDRSVAVPNGVTVGTGADRWEYDFDGSLSGGVGSGVITVAGPHYTWTITVYLSTGAVRSTKVAS